LSYHYYIPATANLFRKMLGLKEEAAAVWKEMKQKRKIV
jgi:hypothetical protein